ncbi:MAG TPA: prephenate dehydrogenase dimerization domain-containing protein, partial [Halanaerobiales bacterium]|nr:prephenate dehydrogenase dimerization domain-containing protein [Halanaerobiales bacterium]
GARVITLTAEEHDKLVSFTSHLPQLLASSVINELISIESKNKNANKLIGQGFLDFTRIAASNSEVWTDIFITNKDNISNMIDNIIHQLNFLNEIITNEDRDRLYQVLFSGRKKRIELSKKEEG